MHKKLVSLWLLTVVILGFAIGFSKLGNTPSWNSGSIEELICLNIGLGSAIALTIYSLARYSNWLIALSSGIMLGGLIIILSRYLVSYPNQTINIEASELKIKLLIYLSVLSFLPKLLESYLIENVEDYRAFNITNLSSQGLLSLSIVVSVMPELSTRENMPLILGLCILLGTLALIGTYVKILETIFYKLPKFG